MAHLAGINKGPVLDWTNDNGLIECFRKWKKKVEILFKGSLSKAITQSNAITLFTGLGKLEWNLLTNGK